MYNHLKTKGLFCGFYTVCFLMSHGLKLNVFQMQVKPMFNKVKPVLKK